MKKKTFLLGIVCMFALGTFAGNADNTEQLDDSTKPDTAQVKSIADIVREQQAISTRNTNENMVNDLWARRGYFCLGYQNSKLTLQDNDAAQRFDNTYGNKADASYKSDWGLSLVWGKSYRLHKRAICNMVQFNIDYTWIDLSVGHYKREGADNSSLYDSSAPLNQNTSSSTYYTPYNLDKFHISYQMTVGPSLTIAPFTLLNSNAAKYVKFNVYFRVGYGASLMAMSSHEESDKNCDESDTMLKAAHKALDDAVKMDWGHGMSTVFGFNVSWKAIGVGYETTSNTRKYQSVTTSVFGKEKTKFKNSNSRIYLQYRF